MPDSAKPVETWITRFLAEEPVRAKSLIVTVLGDAIAPHGDSVWLSSLIALLMPFGVNERLVRTSVFRLTEEGWLVSQRDGRRSLYRLTPQGARRVEHAHRRIYGRRNPEWDGCWTMVFAGHADLDAETRADLRRDLMWEGYGALANGVYGHPSADTSTLKEILDGSGTLGRVLVTRSVQDAPGFDGQAARLAEIRLVQASWPLDDLAARYGSFIERFSPLARWLAEGCIPGDEEAFVLRILLIHAYRRVLLHDPQLPPALLESNWPGHAAYTLTASLYRHLFQPAERFVQQQGGQRSATLSPVDRFAASFAA